MIGIGWSVESSIDSRMVKKVIFSPAQPRRAGTRLTQGWFSARQNSQHSPSDKSCSSGSGRAGENITLPVFSRLRPRWMTFLSILPRTPRRSNFLRPCKVKGASMGKEAILVASGREGGIAAGVGCVRALIVLTILLLLVPDTNATAQLDRLRKSKALDTMAVAETPMVEIQAGEFSNGNGRDAGFGG